MLRALLCGVAMVSLSACYVGLEGEGGEGQADGDGTDGTAGTGVAEETGEPLDPGTAVDDARERLPTYLDLHKKVFWRTCTPDDGVCHNDKEYPDLHTPQSMLAVLGEPCNLAVEDPIETFNGCEDRGDDLTFLNGANGDFVTEIAWTEFDGGNVIIHLRDAIPEAMNNANEPDNFSVTRIYEDGPLLVENFYDAITYSAGATQVTLLDFAGLSDSRKELIDGGLHLGDPNQDGVFGADDAGYTLLTPGDPDSSYLLGRLQATVPGTPMPLANQPLDSAEMLAVICWIEGLAQDGADNVYAAIDYDNCAAADLFGEPQPDSGHSLTNDVQPIFNQSCVGGGCHDAETVAAGLDLTDGNARRELLLHSTQETELYRVVPGNPANSYLMLKLWGKGAAGLQMPRTQFGDGEPLPEETIRVIEQWIIAGAPDD